MDSVSISLPHTHSLRFPTQAPPAVDRSPTMNIDTSEGRLIQGLTRLGNMVEEARLDPNVCLNLRSADKTVNSGSHV